MTAPISSVDREAVAAEVSRGFDPDRDERWRRCGECGCQHCVDLPDGSRFCPTCEPGDGATRALDVTIEEA